MRFAIFTLLLIFLCGVSAYSQGQSEIKWTQVFTGNRDFSVALPGEMLVYQDKKRNTVTIFANTDDASFSVRIHNDPRVNYLDHNKKLRTAEGFSGSEIAGKGFQGAIYIADKKIYRISAYFRTSSGFFSVEVLARSKDSTVLTDFLSSMLIKSVSVISSPKGRIGVSASIPVADLATSPIVREFLNRKQSGKVSFGSGAQPIDLDAFFSRPLLLLEKPYPRYSDAARNDNVQGTVVLHVQFKADGTIGNIWVVQGPVALQWSAVDAAKAIKFLPAEVDGKPVDVVREMEYSFTIY